MLGAFTKNLSGEYISKTSETSKFYLKHKNIYRNIYTPIKTDNSKINLKFYKNDELLSEQNVSRDLLSDELFKDSSSVEYIFSNTKYN